ncbi:MAG TPA: bacterial ammonia monooxygenase, subunit AmoB [Anaerolineaceae bacterium]|nr:bacterial ammonia monooxygenase, subunit AmoB [Anaerolineaceae bacterium]
MLNIKKLITVTLWALSCLMASQNSAYAHGEKALEPFIRMRTIQWYDVRWSQEQLKINDEVVITGKFHVAEDWPRSVPKPDATYLNVSTPGPVFIRTERYLNGQPWVSSAALKLGGDYDFKIVLKARLPGRFHIHPFFNLHDAGSVMGPGHWLEIAGDSASFSNPVKTLNGDVVDMESYGFANGVSWHVFWIVLGSAWLLWWVRRPLFIPRYKMLQAGNEDALITSLDKTIAKAILVVVPMFVLGAYAMTDSQYPNAIPLQAALDQIEPLTPEVNNGLVQVKVKRSEYHVPGRAMILTAQIHNLSDQPVQVGEFASGNLRFINNTVGMAYQDHGDPLVAQTGLKVDSPDPIQPGETRTVQIEAADSLWETEQLDGLFRDADSRLGGLLFLYDATGKRYVASVATAVIPQFN